MLDDSCWVKDEAAKEADTSARPEASI